MSHGVQRCPTVSNGVQRCPTVSNGVQRCPTVSNVVQRCPTMSNGVQRCPTVSNDVQRCPTVSNDVQRCPTMSNDVQRCPTVQPSLDPPKFCSRLLEIHTEPMVSHVAVQCRSSKILFAAFGDPHWTNGIPRCPTLQSSLDHPKFFSRLLVTQTGLVRSS